MKQAHCFLVSFFLAIITHCSWSQVIPSSRTADWTKAGIKGAIPVYPLIKNILDHGGSGDGVTTNDLALQNAISSLNNQNGTIYFPSGTFLFNSPIAFGSGIVLKGEGAANTILKFDLSGTDHLITVSGNASTVIANITAPAVKGTSSISVDDASLFHVNDFIKIYQDDAALVNDSWALESVGQIIRIDSIIGNTIYFSNALRRSYLLADAPKIRRLLMVEGVGIECLKIRRMDATVAQTSNLLFSYAANCWVNGVESDSCNFAHIQISGCTNIEVSNSYFHGAFAYGSGGQGYGISCEYTSGECLIENNIFKRLRHSMIVQSGANGNLFDYNYSIQPFKTDSLPFDLSGDIVLHGNYPYLNLFEGNVVQNIIIDASHSINGPFNTFFRNRAELYGILMSPGSGDSSNIIGNEITGTGFRQGNYFIMGFGNLEHANNKNDTIIPAGSTLFTDRSLVYSATPAFWNIPATWPTLGIPNFIGSQTIPAKERLIPDPTFCLSPTPATYSFRGAGNWSEAVNWSNNKIPPAVLSSGSEIIIDPPVGEKCILNIPYTINPGAMLTVKPGKHFEVGANLTLVK